MKNKYVNRSKISEAKFRELIRFFSLDLTAMQIAGLTGLNRNTVNRYLTEIRKKISKHCGLTSPLATHDIFKFPPAGNQTFSLLIKEYDAKIYTDIAPRKSFIDGDLKEKHIPDFSSNFDLFIDLETGKHHYIGKKNSDPNLHRKKFNRIENFWGTTKSRLAKFKGMHPSTLRFHIKECEFRFNHRGEDLYLLLLKILRKDPLF